MDHPRLCVSYRLTQFLPTKIRANTVPSLPTAAERSGKARQHTRMLELQPDALRISKMLDSDARAALSSMDLTEPVLPPPLPSKWDSWRVWTAAFWSD
jgi:hypothetical protein